MEKKGHPVSPEIKQFVESDHVYEAAVSKNITWEHWDHWLKAIIITHEVLRSDRTFSSSPDISKFARSSQTQKDLSNRFDLLTADGWELWEAKDWLESKIRTYIKRKAFRATFMELKSEGHITCKWESSGDALFKLLPPDLPME